MQAISINPIGVDSNEKPNETYLTILVFCKEKKFCGVGYYDGYFFKVQNRYSGIMYSDITHWAYMPIIE